MPWKILLTLLIQQLPAIIKAILDALSDDEKPATQAKIAAALTEAQETNRIA